MSRRQIQATATPSTKGRVRPACQQIHWSLSAITAQFSVNFIMLTNLLHDDQACWFEMDERRTGRFQRPLVFIAASVV